MEGGGYAVPVIAVLRAALATVLAILACAWGATPADAAPAPRGSVAADCDNLDLNDATAVREHADAVTDVFAGEVLSVERRTYVGGGEGKADQTDGPGRRADPRTVQWLQVVHVEIPYRGAHEEGDRALVVTTPVDDGGFGKLTDGGLYLFFVSAEDGAGRLVAEPCSGTQMLMGGLGATLRDTLHEILVEPTDEGTTPDYTLSTPDDGARTTPTLGRLVAPGAAVALIGVLGLVLLGRISSRRT